jgi:hypothetical protein
MKNTNDLRKELQLIILRIVQKSLDQDLGLGLCSMEGLLQSKSQEALVKIIRYKEEIIMEMLCEIFKRVIYLISFA